MLSEHSARIEGEATATFRILAPVQAIELDLIAGTADHGMSVTRDQVADAGRVDSRRA
jgi:hypothetical protein